MPRLLAILLLPLLLAAAPADLPAGRWVRLGEPSREVPAGILAYSGMALDSAGGRLLLFGGGHADYWGNEVWAFDVERRTWARLTVPTPRRRYLETRFDWDRLPGTFPGLGLPVSRHTYDAIEFVDHLGVMFAGGSSTFSGNERENLWAHYVRGATGPRKDKGWGPFDTWLFDPAKATWTRRQPGEALGDGGNIAAYVPDAKGVVVMRTGAAGFLGPVLYDPGRDAWQPTAAMTARTKPDTGIHQTATYDTRRRRVYLVGGTKPADVLWAWSLEADRWEALRPADGKTPALGDGAGSAYDTGADVLVTFGPRGTWVFHPSTNRWEQHPDAGGPAPQEIYGRLKYDGARRLTYMVAGNHRMGVEVWAFRATAPAAGAR